MAFSKKIKTIALKDVYMSLLLGISDDFDDELLLDAMEILVDL